MQRSVVWVLRLFFAAALLGGGPGALPVTGTVPQRTTPHGTVIIVGGVGGIDVLGCVSQWMLPRAGVPHTVIDFFWSHGRGQIFKDLQDTRHCLKKADELAGLVWYLKLFEPDQPVYLVGKSGGTG